MKIVFVSPFPPLKDGLAGYTKQFVDELRGRGEHVGIISSDRPNPQADVGAAIGLSPRKLLHAYRYLRSERPDIVHVQYTIPAFGLAAFPMWLMLLVAKWRLRIRVIITFHEVKRETMLLGPAGALYMRFVAMLADHITVHTHEATQLLAERCGVAKTKITHINHPLYAAPQAAGDTDAIRARHNLSGRKVVLFFGFIHIDKGIDYLIRAFASATKADAHLADAALVIAGSVRKREGLFKLFEKKDLEYEASLHKLVQELGLQNNVIFTPYVPNEEVGSWFAIADVVVLPYTNLEQSGVLNLALGCRTPMIVSDLGGLGETMASTNALVPPADDAALAAKLRLFLTDRRQTQELTRTYERICAERTVETVTDKLMHLYLCLGERK